MVVENSEEAQELPLEGAGAKLRAARERQKFTLDQVSAETRIPVRHLELIEAGEFGKLPARTYAIGFSRTYAKMVGVDDAQIANMVREELALEDQRDRHDRSGSFEPGDPAKIPSSGLAWAAGIAALLLVAGAVAFTARYFAPGADPAPLQPDPAPMVAEEPEPQNAGPSLAGMSQSAGDPVVFTALEDNVWVRFYDANGTRLLEKQMNSGERFEIPADAQEPRINTGRPDAFAITVGGREVPKLANEPVTIGDAPVSAEALLARAEGGSALPGGDGAPALN